MIRKQFTLILGLLAVFILTGCRSQKQTPTTAEPYDPAVEEPTWINVTMPVRVNIAEPIKFSLNGTATLVRGEYILVIFRTFGFEVASVYLTPEELNFVMKMPSKTWVQEPIGERLRSRDLSFSSLQEAMLGNNAVLSRLPESVKVTMAGTETAPEIIVKTTLKGKKLEVGLVWDLDAAKWNRDNPATFSTPGSGYQRLTLESAAIMLGK